MCDGGDNVIGGDVVLDKVLELEVSGHIGGLYLVCGDVLQFCELEGVVSRRGIKGNLDDGNGQCAIDA